MLGSVMISRNNRQLPAQIASQGTTMHAKVWKTPMQRFSPSVRLSGRMYSSTAKTTLLLTHLLTPWSRVILEKLTGSQLVKKFPAFYWTPKFITALTSARHLSLSWAPQPQSRMVNKYTSDSWCLVSCNSTRCLAYFYFTPIKYGRKALRVLWHSLILRKGRHRGGCRWSNAHRPTQTSESHDTCAS